MPRSHLARWMARTPRGVRSSSLLAPVSLWLLTGACTPGAATPMPEPPLAFDLGGVNQSEVSPVTQPANPDDVVFPGAAGTVPAGAVVRITNLDRDTNVAAVNATAQGAFEAVIGVSDGQELRFEWVLGDERSAPADALFVRPDPTLTYELAVSPRFECVRLTPGFALELASDATQPLEIENACDEPVRLTNPRTRLNLADFTLPGALPAEIPSGTSQRIDVAFQRTAPGLREDVLLVDVTIGAETIRYPITLRAP